MPIVTPDDVATLQATVRAELGGLDAAVAATPPDTLTLIQWQTMRERAFAFLAQAPSWLHTAAQMDAGQQLQRDLAPWHERLSAAGVANVPPAPAPPPKAESLFASLEGMGGLAAAILLLVILRENQR